MPPDKKQRLRLTRLDSVGFVDRGANPVADITLWKRHNPGDDMADQNKKPDQDVLKALAELLQKAGVDATASKSGYAIVTDADSLLKQIAALLAKSGYAIVTDDPNAPVKDSGYAIVTDSGYAIVTDRPRAPFAKRLLARLGVSDKDATGAATAEQEPVNAEVAKRLADAETQVAKAQAEAAAAIERVAKLELERRTQDAVAKAAELKSLPIKADEFGVILRKASDGEKLTDAEVKELERVLSAANEAARVGKLFHEAGSNAAPEGSVRAKVEAEAAQVRKNDPALSEQQARGKVYEKFPELMAQVEAETSR